MNTAPAADPPAPFADLPARSRPVAEALAAAGVAPDIRVLPDSARTAAEAAAALGCAVGAIANSLVFRCDGEPLLVMTSGAHRVDTAFLAERLGAVLIDRAPAATVRSATGQAIGGVAPVGHPAPLRTVVDTSLAEHPVIWAAAGHPHTVFPLTYPELVRLTGGEPAPVVPD
ncbi:YbaK/EbsC family protein [Kitasatospora paranensis]|uniref:YbaK/EbsC family protein n=1 Tax=Kitasatospora paranensis TaxID=258053 RepID=A0ABW2FWJ5_9ACTN